MLGTFKGGGVPLTGCGSAKTKAFEGSCCALSLIALWSAVSSTSSTFFINEDYGKTKIFNITSSIIESLKKNYQISCLNTRKQNNKPGAQEILASRPIHPSRQPLFYSIQNIQLLAVVSPHQYYSHICQHKTLIRKSRAYNMTTRTPGMNNKVQNSHFLNTFQICFCNSISGG